MKIFLGADHAGYALKEAVKLLLRRIGYSVSDEGAFGYDEADDYTDFIKIVSRQVASNPDEDRGIIFGGSGQGEAMVANRFPGVRAAVYYGGPDDIVTLSRQHNDANVLSIGARFVETKQAIAAVRLWLGTPFLGEERHRRRITKIDEKKLTESEF